jgi:hypothetical protein
VEARQLIMELVVDETTLSTDDPTPTFDNKLLVANLRRAPQLLQRRILRPASIRRKVGQSSHETGVLRDLQLSLHASPRRISTTPL